MIFFRKFFKLLLIILIYMIDYDLYQVYDILKKLDINDLRQGSHVLDNWFSRNYDFAYVADCFVNQIPLGVTKTYHNRFKLIFKNKNESEDLYIIIEIGDNEEVTIVTIYPFNKCRRVREVERK